MPAATTWQGCFTSLTTTHTATRVGVVMSATLCLCEGHSERERGGPRGLQGSFQSYVHSGKVMAAWRGVWPLVAGGGPAKPGLWS